MLIHGRNFPWENGKIYTGCTLKLHILSDKKVLLKLIKRPKMTKSNLAVHNEKHGEQEKFSIISLF